MSQAGAGISCSEVMEMVEGAKVVNIMADGSICEDLRTYEL